MSFTAIKPNTTMTINKELFEKLLINFIGAIFLAAVMAAFGGGWSLQGFLWIAPIAFVLACLYAEETNLTEDWPIWLKKVNTFFGKIIAFVLLSAGWIFIASLVYIFFTH